MGKYLLRLAMKNVITILLVITCFDANAQKFKFPLTQDSIIVYEKIITFDTSYKSQILYRSAKTWFVITFTSSKSAIQSDDVANGRIMAKGYAVIPASLHLAGGVGSNCYFTLQLDIKDGKYRYKIFDIYTDGSDITNTYFKSNLTDFYMLYLHDKFKGKLLYSKDHFDKNCLV